MNAVMNRAAISTLLTAYRQASERAGGGALPVMLLGNNIGWSAAARMPCRRGNRRPPSLDGGNPPSTSRRVLRPGSGGMNANTRRHNMTPREFGPPSGCANLRRLKQTAVYAVVRNDEGGSARPDRFYQDHDDPGRVGGSLRLETGDECDRSAVRRRRSDGCEVNTSPPCWQRKLRGRRKCFKAGIGDNSVSDGTGARHAETK
jgi:hypothetical protein